MENQNSDKNDKNENITKAQYDERMLKNFIGVSFCRETLEMYGYDTSEVDDNKMEVFVDELTEALDPYMNDAVKLACDRVGIPKFPEKP